MGNLLGGKAVTVDFREKTSSTMQQGSFLDMLKKKILQTKEESEKFEEEAEEYKKKYQIEVRRREEAEGEVAGLNRRVQLLEEDLERSEERLGTATTKLAEASHSADESERIRKALENRTNMEDDRVAILEAQLAQAKLIAEEADKKYEEVLVNWSCWKLIWNAPKSVQSKANRKSWSLKKSCVSLVTT